MILDTKKYMLSHAHPFKLLAEVLGLISGIYFLWNHHWILALIISMTFFLFSTIFLLGKNTDYLSATKQGKFLLVYTTPLNFFLYNFSAVPLAYRVWTHDFLFIILSIGLFLLPQFL